MLIWNIYITITYGKLLGLLPITIQSILLWLIFTKHEYAKVSIRIWSIVFISIAYGLQFFGRFLVDLTEWFSNANVSHYIQTGLMTILGVLIVKYTNKTIEIIELEKQ
tara:strand:- start:850 stop:1173 length:324 start_codon:yes stop_codon:yes gene_type:complete